MTGPQDPQDPELSAWDVDEPPAGFADRVVKAAMAERAPARRALGQTMAAVAAISVAAAAAAMLVVGRPGYTGEASATARREVVIANGRGTAVLERGARVRWSGDQVVQESGEVFYRVERGGAFRVHTPAGDVDVLGTCFRVAVRSGDADGETDMKREAIGAAAGVAMGALAVVGVYEGKVRVSHAGQRVELGAGESGRTDASGVRKLTPAEERAAEAARASQATTDAPYAEANKNLVQSVADLNKRVAEIEEQRTALGKKLEQAQHDLELAKKADGGVVRTRNEFDLDPGDWGELAKHGTIKFAVPCTRPSGWKPSTEKLVSLGLTPDDAPAIAQAYSKSNQRVWSVVKRLCADAIGSTEVAEKIGAPTCIHLVMDLAREKDGPAADEAMRQVGEIRAGLRPMPGDADPVHPVVRLFLTMTGESPLFEKDLAASFGPEEAHRLAFDDGMCRSRSTFGGPGPRDKKLGRVA